MEEEEEKEKAIVRSAPDGSDNKMSKDYLRIEGVLHGRIANLFWQMISFHSLDHSM